MIIRSLSAIALLWFVTMPSAAQLDRQEEIESLENIRAFGLVVDVEASLALTSDPAFSASALRMALADRLERLGVQRPSFDPLDSGLPYLYVHVHAMEVGDGLVPFAVDASFIQAVRVDSGGQEVMAATWESGYLGLVSYDRLGAISEASEGLVSEFAEDLAAADGGS